MTDLTERWKNGELINEEDAGCYYIETIDGEIYPDCLSPIDGFKNTYNYAVKKILAPAPSYEEWQILNKEIDKLMDISGVLAKNLKPFTDDYFDDLTTKDIAELAKKSIRLTTQHCEDTAEIDKLKELLKECKPYVIRNVVFTTINKGEEADLERNILLTKIDEVLK